MPPEKQQPPAASAHRDGRTSDAENAAGGAGANRRRHSRNADRQRAITVDAVVAAAGLRPETSLARHAGLQINRGIVVNSQLQTSDPAIYALGDCAEINGVVLPFLQPILLSAMCLSKNLLAQAPETQAAANAGEGENPDLPLHLAGDTRRDDLTWNIVAAKEGLVAKGVDAENQLRAFVVSEDKMKEAFALLKQLVS